VGDVVNGIGFSPDGKVLYVLSRKGEITRYNPESRTKLGSTPTGISKAMALAISPDGLHLAAGGGDAEIAVFDASRMVLREKVQGPGDDQIQSVNFSSDSKQMFAGSISSDVAVWDTQRLTKKPRKEFKGLSEWVRGTGFSADGRRVAALDNEKRIVVWDANSGTELKRIEFEALVPKGEDIEVSAAWISPEGTMLIGTRTGSLIHMTVKSPG
jgi:WD40 repeat protein